jgi:hypothetical protein
MLFLCSMAPEKMEINSLNKEGFLMYYESNLIIFTIQIKNIGKCISASPWI